MAIWILWLVEVALIIGTLFCLYQGIEYQEVALKILAAVAAISFIVVIVLLDWNLFAMSKIGFIVLVSTLIFIAEEKGNLGLNIIIMLISMISTLIGGPLYLDNSRILQTEPSRTETITYKYVKSINFEDPVKGTFFYKPLDKTKEIYFVIVGKDGEPETFTLPKSEVDIRSLAEGKKPVLVEKEKYYDRVNKNKKPYVLVEKDSSKEESFTLFALN